MKKIVIIALFLAFSVSLHGQKLSEDVSDLSDACLAIRSAVGSGSLPQLRNASMALSLCNAEPFLTIRCLDESPLSLDGHLVFNREFTDSLVAGRQVYSFAQRLADLGTFGSPSRGTGRTFYASFAVRSGASSRFAFDSRGHQELVVITEPGGLVTLRVHDITHDQWYNDTVDEREGRPVRTLVFDLPRKICTLELEVINTGERDTSFVIISN
jgi:hypothetical protein